MANNNAGWATLAIDGTTFNLVSDAGYSTGGRNRETQGGQDRIHGFKELPKAPFIKGKIRDGSGMSVASFNSMTNSTVTLTLNNGKMIVGQGMWTVEVQEVDSTEAMFDVRFEGVDGSVTEQ